MSRFTSNWLNHELMLMPGFFFEGEGAGGSGGGAGSGPAGAGDGSGENNGGNGEGGSGGSGKTYDEATVAALRKEAAGHRTRANAAEAELKKLKDAELSETDRLKKEADGHKKRAEETEQKSRARVAKAETLTAATEAKFHKPSLAYDLIAGKIEFDDDGEPKNVAELIKQLAEDNPFLVKGEDGGNTQTTSNTNGATGRNGKWTAESAEKLAATNPAEFNRRYNAGEFKGIL